MYLWGGTKLTREKKSSGEPLTGLDDFIYFRVLGETSSFRKAAAKLGVSPQRIRTRIDALENQAGVMLFTRTNVGALLTDDGRRLYDDLDEFWRTASVAKMRLTQSGGAMRGEVVISVTESIGTFWLIPRFADFLQRNEDLTVSLHADADIGRPERGDCDIAVSLERPRTKDLIVKRIGYLHVMPFAADLYLKRHGKPKCPCDIHNHRIVEQIAEKYGFQDFEDECGGKMGDRASAIRTNTSAGHFWSVAQGAGIGLLPTYYRAIANQIRPIDMGLQLRREIWLSFAKGTRSIERVSQVLDFITLCFDADEFPWFGETFIHPDELDQWFQDHDLDKRFESFMEHCLDIEQKTHPKKS